MARVLELLDSLGIGEDGISTAYPDTFTDDIRNAYAEDASIPDARIQVLEADLAAANAAILQLKAHNYELMTQVPSNETEEEPEEEADDSEDESDSKKGVDSLFTKKDEN